MMKGLISAILILWFIGWIMIATDPQVRINRGCAPVGWTGSLFVSLTAMVWDSQVRNVQGVSDRMEYGCRYALWRSFYEKDYLAAGHSLPSTTIPNAGFEEQKKTVTPPKPLKKDNGMTLPNSHTDSNPEQEDAK